MPHGETVAGHDASDELWVVVDDKQFPNDLKPESPSEARLQQTVPTTWDIPNS